MQDWMKEEADLQFIEKKKKKAKDLSSLTGEEKKKKMKKRKKRKKGKKKNLRKELSNGREKNKWVLDREVASHC